MRPSLDERKQQKWHKANVEEGKRNLKIDGQLEPKSIESIIMEQKEKKQLTRSRPNINAQKSMKHIGKHIVSALAFPRNDELQWMLKHSPYIADSGTEEKKHFIQAVTSSHSSHRQLKALPPKQQQSEHIMITLLPKTMETG